MQKYDTKSVHNPLWEGSPVVMTKRTKLYLVLLAVIVVAILALLIWHAVAGGAEPAAQPVIPAEGYTNTQRPVKFVEVEKTISTEMISEKLNDVGLLVTEEYLFTEVVSYSSIKKLWNIDLGFTETSYLAGYDGTVTAGIDFSQISVSKDDEQRKITVYLPRPQLLGVDIDPKSFRLYSEKEGLWNRLTVTDFNDSLIELEDNARAKAVEKGILERAGANARLVVENLIGSLVDTEEYGIITLYA